MLYVVHGCYVVAVIVNFHGTRQIGPGPRLVTHLNFISLHLPRIDTREGLVVISELKIASDAQSIDRTRYDAEQQRVFVDARDVSGRIVARVGNGVCW